MFQNVNSINPDYIHPLPPCTFRACFQIGLNLSFYRNVGSESLTHEGFISSILVALKDRKEEMIQKTGDRRVFKGGLKVFKDILYGRNGFERQDFNTQNERERDRKLNGIIKLWREKFYATREVTHLLDDFRCEGYHFLGNPPPITSRHIPMVCSDYAFLQLAEERAYWFYFSNLADGDNHIDILLDWGYEPVTTPTIGDLVLYCSQKEAGLWIHHFGIWKGPGQVVSKWGTGEVWEHPPQLVYEFYGNGVIFFRKPVYKEVLAALKAELHQKAPLTQESVTSLFREAVEHKLKACHTESLAYRFFTTWLEVFPTEIRKVPLEMEYIYALLDSTAAAIPLSI